MTQEVFENLTLQEETFSHLLEAFPELQQQQIQAAYAHATKAHTGQERDGGIPYIVHPLRVSIILLKAGEKDANIIIAALLHDVVEDCTDTIDDIEELYNAEVAVLVKDATRERPDNETAGMKRIAKPKKFRWYIEEASVDSCKIKTADVIDNMRSWQYIPKEHTSTAKFPRWCDEAMTFYPELTTKAGPAYVTLWNTILAEYQSLPQFQPYLTTTYE